MIQSTSFQINGMLLETMGLVYGITNTYGSQLVVPSYGLMLFGLCYRSDEQWSTSGFTAAVNSWTLAFSAVTTNWSSVSLPSSSWTLAVSGISTSWSSITLPTTTWNDG